MLNFEQFVKQLTQHQSTVDKFIALCEKQSLDSPSLVLEYMSTTMAMAGRARGGIKNDILSCVESFDHAPSLLELSISLKMSQVYVRSQIRELEMANMLQSQRDPRTTAFRFVYSLTPNARELRQ